MRYADVFAADDPAPRLGLLRGDVVVDSRTAVAHSWPDAPHDARSSLIQRGTRRAGTRSRELVSQTAGRRRTAICTCRRSAGTRRFRARRKNIVLSRAELRRATRRKARRRAAASSRFPTVPVFFTKAPTSVSGPFDDRRRGSGRSRSSWTRKWSSAWSSARAARTSRGPTRSSTSSATRSSTTSQRARPAEDAPAVVQGQEPRRLLSDGPGHRHRRRVRRPAEQAARAARQRRRPKQDASTANMIFPVDVIIESLSHGMTLERGRRHRDRHAGRRRPGPHAAGVPAGRRRRRNRSRRHRDPAQSES